MTEQNPSALTLTPSWGYPATIAPTCPVGRHEQAAVCWIHGSRVQAGQQPGGRPTPRTRSGTGHKEGAEGKACKWHLRTRDHYVGNNCEHLW
jgi:hypothetical protein